VVSDGAAPLVTDALEGQQRLLVVNQGFGMSSLGVRQNSEVLFGAPAELGTGAAQLERTVKLLPCGLQGAALEVEVRQRVERFSREDHVTHLGGRLVAPLAQLAGADCFILITKYHP